MKRREYVPSEEGFDPKRSAKNAANAIMNVRAGGKWYVVNLANDDDEKLINIQSIVSNDISCIRNGERAGDENVLVRCFHMIDREIVRRSKGEGRIQLLHAKKFYEAAFEVLTDEEIDRVVARMASVKAQAAE